MEISKFEDFVLLSDLKILRLCNYLGLDFNYLKGDNIINKKRTLHNSIMKNSNIENIKAILNRTTIGISYSSKNKDIMTTISDYLRQNNYDIYSDQTSITDTKRIISEFEKKLATRNVLLVLISEDFLRSEHCMFELFFNFISCKQDIHNIVNHTVPIIIKGTSLDDASLLEHTYYWKQQQTNLNKMFNDLSGTNRTVIGDRISRIDNIAFHFNNIMYTLKDINMLFIGEADINNSLDQIKERIEEICQIWE